MVFAPEDPRQPETSKSSTMPLSLGAELRNDQNVRTPESNLRGSDIDSSNHHRRPGDTNLHHDEYTTLLKKHLCIVESELSILQCRQT